LSILCFIETQEENMKLRLDHINLTVANLNDSIEWYRRIFGFELVESGVSHLGIHWGIVAFDDNMICMSEHPKRKHSEIDQNELFHQIYHFGIRVSDEMEWRQTVA
jgi:catechol 2,3-dioxygenase-like lactoylglutathione lyase family enzyme